MTLNLLAMGRDIASAFSFTLLYIHIRDPGVHKHGPISAFCLVLSLSPLTSKIDVLGSDYVLALWLHMDMHVLVSARVPVQGRGSKKSRIYAVRCKRKCKSGCVRRA